MAKSKVLKGPTAAAATIDLYGLCGSFALPGSKITIRFLSTYATPEGDPGHVTLLHELKPMRERVQASELKDLTSLLQRDLNDERVATELVPYLLGEKSQIGFFPAVLAVLVPKEFISASLQAKYPAAKAMQNVVSYGEHWSFQRYEIDGKVVPLAMLQITIPKTDIIVLDGQHRASAFRRVAGLFPPNDTIYEAFYGPTDKAMALKAELPVTLIWFETSGDEPISPNLISRQLFVDVNNNAREVSKARTILLDDRHVSAIAAQEVYRFAAERSFAAERFSLLHSAFDMGVDLSERSVPAFALTTPEIVDDALRWAFFCSATYDSLGYWGIGRMHEQRNRARFLTLFPEMNDVELSADDDETQNPLIRTASRAREFRRAFEKQYRPILCSMLGDFGFLAAHYKAAAEVEEWIKNVGNSTVRTVWSKVFRGGEGLYWILKRPQEDHELASYGEAIAEIEGEFVKRRAKHAHNGNARAATLAFDAFRSKAFQIGYVMAVDYLASRTGDWLTASDELIGRLNEYSSKNWIAALTELRPLLVGSTGTTPRTWPAHRNLLLRLYDARRGDVYTEDNWADSPEWRACVALLDRVGDGILETNEALPANDELKIQAEVTVKKLFSILRSVNVQSVLSQATMVQQSTGYLTEFLSKRFKTD